MFTRFCSRRTPHRPQPRPGPLLLAGLISVLAGTRPAAAQIVLTGSQSATLVGVQTTPYVSAYDSSTFTQTGGEITVTDPVPAGAAPAGGLNLFGGSTATVSGGLIDFGIVTSGSSRATISGGTVSGGLTAYGSSGITVSGDANINGALDAYNSSRGFITGGTINSGVNIHDTGAAFVLGGTILGGLGTYGSSTATVGGSADVEGVSANDGSTIIVSGGTVGNGLYTFGGTIDLFGAFTDGGGNPLTAPLIGYSGTILGTLAGGQALNTSYFINGGLIEFNVAPTPEPSSALALALGLFGLACLRLRARRGAIPLDTLPGNTLNQQEKTMSKRTLASVWAALAVVLLTLWAGPRASAAGPVITAGIGPATLPVTGGVITVTATVTDALPITRVSASVLLNGKYYGYDNVTMSNNGGGTVYSATVPTTSGNNTGLAPLFYTATVTVTDSSGSSAASASGQVTQANDATPPTISNAGIGPAVLAVTGGVITVKATVTDLPERRITRVSASVPVNGKYYGYDNVTMSNGGSGSVYTATIPANGNNTGNAPAVYTAALTATNDLGLSNTATAAGQVVQANDNTPPTISNVSIGPATLPVTGGVITVTATIVDTKGRLITSAYMTVPGFNGDRPIALSSGGSGNVYSGTIHVGSNGGTAPVIYTATVTATNDLNVSNTAAAAGQVTQANSGPAASVTPLLYTVDPMKPVLSPNSVTAGGPGLVLTINGANFSTVVNGNAATGATVLFNGVTLMPSGITPTQIIVTIPAVLVAQSGPEAVSVVNPVSGGYSSSNSVDFVVR